MFKNIPKDPIKFGLYISSFHRRFMIAALTCVFVATILDRFTVVVLRNLTNAVISPHISMSTVWFWALGYPILLLSSNIVWRLSGLSGMNWFMNYRATAYQALYEYLTLHSKDYFNNRFAGALTNKIGHAVDGTEDLFEKSLWQFIPLSLGLILYIIFSWSADYRLGLIIAVWSVIFLWLNIWFSQKLQPLSLKSAESLSTLKGVIVDSLSNISLVHEYAHVTGEREYIKKYILTHKRSGLRHWILSEGILFINNVLLFFFIVSMIATSIMLFASHTISVGVIVMVVTIVSNVTSQFL
ncbi:MAG: ABC transporter transmembrane domain-containing protein, partial [Candidatus Levyibacteriota bacterium]